MQGRPGSRREAPAPPAPLDAAGEGAKPMVTRGSREQSLPSGAIESARAARAAHDDVLNELRQAREELRDRRLDLERARSEIQAHRWRYQQLFDLASIGYVISNAEGVIREANSAAGALLNVAPRYLVKRPLSVFVVAADRQSFRRGLTQLEREDPERQWILRLEPRYRAPVHVAATISVERDPAGRPLLLRWELQNVTERLRVQAEIEQLTATLEQRVAERTAHLERFALAKEELLLRERQTRLELEEARKRLALNAGASAVLVGSLDAERAITAVARLAVPTIADWTMVDLIADDGTVRRAAGAHVDPALEGTLRELARQGVLESTAVVSTQRVLRGGALEVLNDIPDARLEEGAPDPEHARLLRALGLRSCLVAPMRVGERLVGAIVFASRTPGRYGVAELDLAQELATRAVLAADNARLFRAERDARLAAERAMERVARLQGVTAALSSALTPAETAEVVVRQGLAAMGASAGSVAVVSSDGTALEMVQELGYGPIAEEFKRFPVGASLPMADAVRSGEAVFLASLAERRARYPHLAREQDAAGPGAVAALPLIVNDRVTGAMGITFPDEREFGRDDRVFMMTLARQCAQALERARLYEAEQRARADAEAANRSKSEFLATLSHELRTPLTTIGGYAELLEMGMRGPITETQAGDLRRIRRAQTHIASIISNLVNFVRAEGGRLTFSVTDVDAGELVDDTVAFAEPLFAVKRLRFAACGASHGVLARADREKAQQILINLLSNAAKYTPAGGAVRLEWEGYDRTVAVRVSDTGPGIPADELQRIFEPFYRGAAARAEEVAGTGLGLAISRDLARAMGGDLTVQSEAGRGATFTLTLQRACPAPAVSDASEDGRRTEASAPGAAGASPAADARLEAEAARIG